MYAWDFKLEMLDLFINGLKLLGHVTVIKQKRLCQLRSRVGGVWKKHVPKKGHFYLEPFPLAQLFVVANTFKSGYYRFYCTDKEEVHSTFQISAKCISFIFREKSSQWQCFENYHKLQGHAKQCDSREQVFILWSPCFIGCSAFALCKHPSGHRW